MPYRRNGLHPNPAFERGIIMDFPIDVIEARRLLENAEKEGNPERKFNELKEGIDLLELYLDDNPESSEELTTFITNIRRAHTRRLLSQILSIKKIDFETWLQYIVFIITKLKNEVEFVTEQDPELKKNYDEFHHVWSDVLQEILEQYKANSANKAPKAVA